MPWWTSVGGDGEGHKNEPVQDPLAWGAEEMAL